MERLLSILSTKIEITDTIIFQLVTFNHNLTLNFSVNYFRLGVRLIVKLKYNNY